MLLVSSFFLCWGFVKATMAFLQHNPLKKRNKTGDNENSHDDSIVNNDDSYNNGNHNHIHSDNTNNDNDDNTKIKMMIMMIVVVPINIIIACHYRTTLLILSDGLLSSVCHD